MNTAEHVRRSMLRIALLSLLPILFLGGCAGMGTVGSKYMNQRTFAVSHDIDIAEATDIAVTTLQIMGVTLTQRNSSAGFLAGELKKGFWVNRVTYFVELYISTPDSRQIKLHASAIAGPEVAFTDELDDIVEEFYETFEKSLASLASLRSNGERSPATAKP